MSEDFGLMFSVRNADDVAQFVRHCTIRGGALWGHDFPMDSRSVRYPLVVYIYNPWRSGAASEGVQAYGTVTRVSSGPQPVPPSNPDLVPAHLRAEAHKTWFHFDQILNVNPAVSFTEFYTADRQKLAAAPKDKPILLGPPYPVKHK